MPSLVTIAHFPTAAEAALAQNELALEGIKSRLADTEVVTAVWHYGGALGGVKLQVLAEDVDRAKAVLASLATPADEEDDDPDATEHHALPDDEESPTAEVDEIVNRAWKAAVIGLFLCPLQLYALYLLLTIPSGGPPLSPANRLKVGLTLAIVVAGLLLLWLFLRAR